jgi:MinD-like ATPase involved in chromosome partitioning or flagellar assembly
MKTLMFYSYKGGSGRTVAAANVAAAFAKLGQRTAIIDLDFEAPGLHHVFAAERTPQCLGEHGIQHYLKGVIDLDQLMDDCVIDMFSADGPLKFAAVPERAGLLFIVASPKVAYVDSHEPEVEVRMNALRRELQDRGTDILIIDAASGVRDAYSIAAQASDEMVMFFRWSKQHVAGTLRMAEYMKRLRKYGDSKPFRLVASACPKKGEIDDIADEKLRDALAMVREETLERIRAILVECDANPPDVFFEIPESTEMKWRESVVVFRSNDSDYEALARKLLDAHRAS